jgi:hypothetical protein
MQINLAQHLKLKARLSGKLKEMNQQLTSHNSQAENELIPLTEINKRRDNVSEKLIQAKVMIAQLNTPIMEKLILLPELKGELVLYKGLNTFEGERSSRDWETSEMVKVKYVAFVNREAQQSAVDHLEKSINKLQDEIDAYNGMTTVEVPDDFLDF